MQDVNKIIEYYENLDTTDFPEVQPKLIAELRNRKAEFQKKLSGIRFRARCCTVANVAK